MVHLLVVEQLLEDCLVKLGRLRLRSNLKSVTRPLSILCFIYQVALTGRQWETLTGNLQEETELAQPGQFLLKEDRGEYYPPVKLVKVSEILKFIPYSTLRLGNLQSRLGPKRRRDSDDEADSSLPKVKIPFLTYFFQQSCFLVQHYYIMFSACCSIISCFTTKRCTKKRGIPSYENR